MLENHEESKQELICQDRTRWGFLLRKSKCMLKPFQGITQVTIA